MLPKGSLHINDSQAHVVAKKIGIDYARAVTGFNHQGRNTHPVYQGIVVAQEHGQMLLEV